MIPFVIPPLKDLRILVTRPAQQAQSLCTRIKQLGGIALGVPLLEIKPCDFNLPTQAHDLLIFISANAVTHGLALLQSQVELAGSTPLIAAVGNATAAALTQAGYAPDIIAATPFNSEALLAHEALQSPPENILLIRGAGGRELLHDTLVERGSEVAVVAVYERVAATVTSTMRTELAQALRDGIDVITITSTEILHALNTLFDDTERAQLQRITAVAGSTRIAAQLPAAWRDECIVSASPDDTAILTALTRWHTRARN